MLYFLIITGILGLVVGILMLIAPSILQKFNVWANATLISTDKVLIIHRRLVGIILSLLSLYILWAAACIILK